VIETLKAPGLLVLDDVLDEDAWSEIWTYFQFEDLAPTTRTDGAWRLEDGGVLAGPDFHAASPWLEGGRSEALEEVFGEALHPTGAPPDYLLEVLVALAERGELEPVQAEWEHIVGRAYVYPAGSALSWHRDDHDSFAGAFVYYAHPEWNVQWGGELFVADVEDPLALPVTPFRFENRAYSEALLERGLGRYIAPKPNRLVVLGAQHHRVAPVSAAAGRAVRASLAGFFVRQGPAEPANGPTQEEEARP
jgi:hypothetical protein